LGGLRITHYGRLAGGKKVGWIHSFIWGFAFLGITFCFAYAVVVTDETIVIVVSCSQRPFSMIPFIISINT